MNHKESFVPLYIYLIVISLLLAVTHIGNRVVTVLSETVAVVNRSCIVIDAGHGGVDGGATSCTGVLESDINLQIALKLDDLFHLLGKDTIMIRTTDRSVYTEGESIAQKKISDLKERVRIVNHSGADAFISIHQNYFSQSQYYGPQVFFNGVKGSKQLADKLQKELNGAVAPDSKRSTKLSSGIYLMEHTQCPSVLIECGFISNPEEAIKLTDGTYQNKLCSVIASICSQYLEDTDALS